MVKAIIITPSDSGTWFLLINNFEIIDIKDEHFEQIFKMIAKFGVPTEAEHYESVEKLKKQMEDGKRGKLLECRSGELVGFIFYCSEYVWPLEV